MWGKLSQFVSTAETERQQNQNCVVLAALKRKQSKLSSMQGKLFGVNERVGVAVSGLSTDSATLVKLLREESVREEFVFGRVASPSKLASLVSKSLQVIYAECYHCSSFTSVLDFNTRICRAPMRRWPRYSRLE